MNFGKHIFGVPIMLQAGLLVPFANPARPVPSKLLLPLWRGASDLVIVCATVLAIYFLYWLLATMT
jgi:hypothetical protein